MTYLKNILLNQIIESSSINTIEDLILYKLVDWTIISKEEALASQESIKQQITEEIKIKEDNLYKAENAYIAFARSLNLSDKASTEEIKTLALSLKEEAMTLIGQNILTEGFSKYSQAVEIPLLFQSLFDNIIIAGGSYDTITYHDLSPIEVHIQNTNIDMSGSNIGNTLNNSGE